MIYTAPPLDSRRPVTGLSLAWRGWPSGLRYESARILQFPLIPSRLSTFRTPSSIGVLNRFGETAP
jgi:hypothetical protein